MAECHACPHLNFARKQKDIETIVDLAKKSLAETSGRQLVDKQREYLRLIGDVLTRNETIQEDRERRTDECEKEQWF